LLIFSYFGRFWNDFHTQIHTQGCDFRTWLKFHQLSPPIVHFRARKAAEKYVSKKSKALSPYVPNCANP